MAPKLARIDLKNVTIKILDGKAIASTALLDGAVSVGDTTVTLATGGVAAEGLAVGDWISPDSTGFRPRYWITKIDADELTLDRASTEAWTDAAVFGRQSPNEVEINIGEGNITWSTKDANEYRLNKRSLDTVVSGDEQPMDVSFSIVWDALIDRIGGSAPRPYEALKNIGEAAAWISAGELCEKFAVDIVVYNEPDCATLTDPSELYIFPMFRWDEIAGDMSNNALEATGRCNVLEPVIARYGS